MRLNGPTTLECLQGLQGCPRITDLLLGNRIGVDSKNVYKADHCCIYCEDLYRLNPLISLGIVLIGFK